MVDARRALPAVPAALCCGVGAMMMLLRRPEMPAVTLGIGGSLGGDTCTDAELARVRHVMVAAPTSFAGVVATYAALDRATRPRRRAVP